MAREKSAITVADLKSGPLRDRVLSARERLTKLYRQEDTARPFWRVYEYPPERSEVPIEEALYDPDVTLRGGLEWILGSMRYEGDFIPTVHVTGFVVGIPSAFGCEIVQPKGACPWVEPLIKDYSDVFKLKKPKPTDGLLGKALEATSYVQDKVNGASSVRLLNIQGPLTNAGYLCGDSEYLMALYDHPKEMHALLDMITDLMIEFVHAQRALVSDFNPIVHCPDWIPDGFGIGIADDYAGVISPALYEEFALPYNNRLSREFGGIGIHSCGCSEGTWDIILKHDNLRVVNFELTDNSLEKMVETFSGKAIIAPHAPFRQKRYPKMIDMVRHMLDVKRDDTAMVITLEKHARVEGEFFYEEDDGFQEAYELLRNVSGG
jgi:hypothetical protein